MRREERAGEGFLGGQRQSGIFQGKEEKPIMTEGAVPPGVSGTRGQPQGQVEFVK